MSEDYSGPGNPDLLRRDIDHGKTADKVRFPDPAAAPLGTDDEAGGTPWTAAVVAQARRQERSVTPNAAPRAHSGPGWRALAAALIACAGIVLVFALIVL